MMHPEPTWSLFHNWPHSFTRKSHKRQLSSSEKRNGESQHKVHKKEVTFSSHLDFDSSELVTSHDLSKSLDTPIPPKNPPFSLPISIKPSSSRTKSFPFENSFGGSKGNSAKQQLIKQENLENEEQDMETIKELSERLINKSEKKSNDPPLITTIPISGKKEFIASVLATASEESNCFTKSDDEDDPSASSSRKTKDKVIQLSGDHTYFEFQSPKKKVILKITKNPDKPTEKIKTLDELISLLEGENLLSGDAQIMLEAFMELPSGLTRNRSTSSSSVFRTQMKYTAGVEKFASTLYFHSPRAYEYVSKIFLLPELCVLRETVKTWNFFPGFSQEALSVLKDGFSKASATSKLCSIMIVNVKIKEQCDFLGDDGVTIGHVDFGGGQSPQDSDGVPLATDALLFVAVGLASDWKLPFGYFLNRSLSAEFMKTLVNEAVIILEQYSLDVRALVCDDCGCPSFLGSSLGCRFKVKAFRDIETGFQHPTKSDRKIQLVYSASYGLKLLRNILADKGSLQSTTYGKIEWKFLSLLLDISDHDLYYETANNPDFEEFYHQKMKIKIGCHSVGNSLGKTLELVEKLPSLEIKGFTATANFAADIDRAFDTLNSRNPVSPGERSPMYQYTVEEQKESLIFVARRIMGLELVTGKRVIDEGRRMSVITFASTLKAFCQLASDLVNRNVLRYLCTYRLNLQHAEMILSCFQRTEGWHGLPSAAEFRSAFKKNIKKADAIMRSNARFNTDIEGEDISVATSHLLYSNDFEGENLTIGQGIIYPCRGESCGQILSSDSNFIPHHLDLLDQGLERTILARFVAEQVAKKLSCSECIGILLTDEYRSIFLNHVTKKIQLNPSEYVLRIIRICERSRKVHLLHSWPMEIEQLIIIVFREYSQLYDDLGIAENSVPHYLEEPYHVICLTKVVIRTFLNLMHKSLHKFI